MNTEAVETTKHAGGRPPKYCKTYCKRAIEMGKDGKTWTAIAATLDVTRDTLYRWMDVYPEFSDAMKKSREHAAQWWEDTLQDQARGKIEGGSTTAAIFAMKNQFPDDYKDRKDLKVDTHNTFDINFMGYDPDEDEEAES